MVKAICYDCRHFQKQNVFPASWCMHPNATTIDRIRGEQHPRLEPALSEEDEKRVKAVLDRCDKEGWFEKRRAWWVF